MDYLFEAAVVLNHKFQDLNGLKDLLVEAGFEDVTQTIYKWPSNTWPKDQKHKEIGAWNYENIVSGLMGFLMAPLTRALNWRAEEVEVLVAQVRKEMKDKSIHAYWPM
jgi:hypothetical protein